MKTKKVPLAGQLLFYVRTYTPRARDFPNPHDGEIKSDPEEEKLYETPTKKTMILMKWVDWEFSEIQSITLSYNKNN